MTFVLYRFYGEAGLLYVGQTSNPGARIGEHRRSKAWWKDVRRIEIQHFASLGLLKSAELEAIRTECPKYNVAGVRARDRADIEWYVTTDSDAANGCSEWIDHRDAPCGRPVSFHTSCGNYVCAKHASYYGMVKEYVP